MRQLEHTGIRKNLMEHIGDKQRVDLLSKWTVLPYLFNFFVWLWTKEKQFQQETR